MVNAYANIDALKSQLDSFRPLPPDVVRNLRNDLVIRWTYHSNAIEGNTLTLMETKVVLEGVTVGGKPLREHFEAINHQQAIFYVEQIIANQEPLSEWQIRNLHQLILKNIDDDNAGRYRHQNVMIAGANHFPPDHLAVADNMVTLMDWYHGVAQQLHPVERASQLHADFVNIHPFIDGNGRTARLLLNLELMKAGYPPCVITVDKRLAYYQALDNWATGKTRQDFINLIIDSVEASFQPYRYVLGF